MRTLLLNAPYPVVDFCVNSHLLKQKLSDEGHSVSAIELPCVTMRKKKKGILAVSSTGVYRKYWRTKVFSLGLGLNFGILIRNDLSCRWSTNLNMKILKCTEPTL